MLPALPSCNPALSKGRGCCCGGDQPELGQVREGVWHSAPLLLLPSFASAVSQPPACRGFSCPYAEEQLMCEMPISAEEKHIPVCYLSVPPRAFPRRTALTAHGGRRSRINPTKSTTGMKQSFRSLFMASFSSCLPKRIPKPC